MPFILRKFTRAPKLPLLICVLCVIGGFMLSKLLFKNVWPHEMRPLRGKHRFLYVSSTNLNSSATDHLAENAFGKVATVGGGEDDKQVSKDIHQRVANVQWTNSISMENTDKPYISMEMNGKSAVLMETNVHLPVPVKSISVESERPSIPRRQYSVSYDAPKILKKFFKKNRLYTLTNYSFFSSPYPRARVGDHECRDSMCSEYLDEVNLFFYKFCTSKAIIKLNLPLIVQLNDTLKGKCRFMDSRERPPVALVSFPGSGNTWMRGLLELATGLCTGSVYCDNFIRHSGMNGEKVISGSVLVVKTHFHRETIWSNKNKLGVNAIKAVPNFGSVVLLVRNPFNALLSEWHRQVGKKIAISTSHVGSVGSEHFGNDSSWNQFIQKKLTTWRSYFPAWVVPAIKGNYPLHVVRYEDVRNNTVAEIKKILDFLRIPYLDEDLKDRLKRGFSTFKRNHTSEFEPFTPSQKTLIRDTISRSVSYLKAHANGNSFGIEDYLNTWS